MTRAPLVRLGRARLAAVPNPDPEPPACNVDTHGGFCHLDEGHSGGHLPMPANYPPKHVHGAWCHPSADGCPDDLRPPPKTDGGPSVAEFLRSKGELV